MQRISVLITSSPESLSACTDAVAFCHAAVAQGQSIEQIFFYQAGVYHANGLIDKAASEVDLPSAWQTFATANNVPLLVCVGAAGKRGVVDAEQAEQAGLEQHNLFAPFKQVGLGEFFTLLHNSDKLVQF
jgi:tRNA 2-thiouridine synthesizing protein D